MNDLSHARWLWSDLLQYAQHVETITGEPTEADFTALQRCTELCSDITEAVAAYHSEVVNEKRQLAACYPSHHMEWIRQRQGG